MLPSSVTTYSGNNTIEMVEKQQTSFLDKLFDQFNKNDIEVIAIKSMCEARIDQANAKKAADARMVVEDGQWQFGKKKEYQKIGKPGTGKAQLAAEQAKGTSYGSLAEKKEAPKTGAVSSGARFPGLPIVQQEPSLGDKIKSAFYSVFGNVRI